ASTPAAPARVLPASRPARVSAQAEGIPMPTAPVTMAAGRVKASPLAKKIAAQAGMDLRLVRGSGPGGRIIRRDVEAATVTVTVAASPAAVMASPAVAPTVPGVEYEDRPLSQIRAAIA